jgi:CheY-like chemotaxis protein
MKKVLVITDNIDLLSTVAYDLEGNGYDVEVSQSPPQTLYSLQTGAYDGVISDIDSPDVDGLDLARIAVGLQKRIRVILVTANRIQSDFRKFPCLKTPFKKSKLLRLLRSGPLEAERAGDR